MGAVATRMGSAVYFIPSLCNHSCDPNVDVGFEDGSSRMTLRARREIEAGEELSITYVDAGLPRETRQRTLLQGYGFTCMCPACAARVMATTALCPVCRQRVADSFETFL